jgi:hypothetical protein
VWICLRRADTQIKTLAHLGITKSHDAFEQLVRLHKEARRQQKGEQEGSVWEIVVRGDHFCQEGIQRAAGLLVDRRCHRRLRTQDIIFYIYTLKPWLCNKEESKEKSKTLTDERMVKSVPGCLMRGMKKTYACPKRQFARRSS